MGKLAYRILVVLSVIIVILYCTYRLTSRKPIQTPEPTPETPVGFFSPDQTGAPSHQRREGTYTPLPAANNQSGNNTDIVIVASYDTEVQKVGMVSVPRDTLLESGKINVAYHKGPKNLRDTVSNSPGVSIDYCVAVNVGGSAALVGELGGIEFDVPTRMSFDNPTQDPHIHHQLGLQHPTSEDVPKVICCCNNSDGPGSYPDNLYGVYPDGGIGRTRTQQQLIAAILKRALSNPQRINSYVNLFLEYVDTDLEFSEALRFAQFALDLDSSTDLTNATLAGENVYYMDNRGYYRGSCHEPDPEVVLKIVNSLINPHNAPLTVVGLNIFRKLWQKGAVAMQRRLFATPADRVRADPSPTCGRRSGPAPPPGSFSFRRPVRPDRAGGCPAAGPPPSARRAG